MNEKNPSSKDINIKTQEGLDKLKLKADYYGHYAEFLKVKDLIQEIEDLKRIQKEASVIGTNKK
jgi:hypothetical protein